jgi:hypothetical protein
MKTFLFVAPPFIHAKTYDAGCAAMGKGTIGPSARYKMRRR